MALKKIQTHAENDKPFDLCQTVEELFVRTVINVSFSADVADTKLPFYIDGKAIQKPLLTYFTQIMQDTIKMITHPVRALSDTIGRNFQLG